LNINTNDDNIDNDNVSDASIIDNQDLYKKRSLIGIYNQKEQNKILEQERLIKDF